MRAFAYVWCWNLVGFADPCWKCVSRCLSMIRGGMDCEERGTRLEDCSGLGGGVVRNIPLV